MGIRHQEYRAHTHLQDWQAKNCGEGSRGAKAHGKQVNEMLQKRYKGIVLEEHIGCTQMRNMKLGFAGTRIQW